MYLNRDMDGRPFLLYFLPILGGRRPLIYVLFPSHSWWAENCNVRLSKGMVCNSRFISFPLSFNIRANDRTDGQRTDDGTDDETHGFRGGFIFHPDIL